MGPVKRIQPGISPFRAAGPQPIRGRFVARHRDVRTVEADTIGASVVS